MPSKTAKQRRYIFFLRGRYKSEENTPENKKWIWEKGWEDLDPSAKEIKEEGTLMDHYLQKVYNENSTTMNHLAEDKFHMLLQFGVRTKEAAENLLRGFGIKDELLNKILGMFTQ